MADKNMIELPLDADGKPIHVGDKMIAIDGLSVHTVTAMALFGDGWTIHFGIADWEDPTDYRHCLNTVDTLLTEFGYKWYLAEDAHDSDIRKRSLIAEYASKLRSLNEEVA